MPLDLDEKVALNLRLASARHLGDKAGPPPLQAEQVQVNAARSAAEHHAVKAGARVTDLASATSQLDLAEQELRDYSKPVAYARIDGAADEVRNHIARSCACNGDSRINADLSIEPLTCVCGVLPMATEIESAVRNHYSAVPGIGPIVRNVAYNTTIVPANTDFGTLLNCSVDGNCTIEAAPATVTISIADNNISSLDLCSLAYVITHELVCHGFQAAEKSTGTDSSFLCHWSEAWMDVVALGVVTEWASSPAASSLLPFTGSSAMMAFANYHESRYWHRPNGIKNSTGQSRRWAREAHDRLGHVLAKRHGETARRFCLSVNVHAEAEVDRLDALAIQLQLAFADEREPEWHVPASFCADFIKIRNINALEKSLSMFV